ncbi:MAG: ATP-dependent DNA ligase [Candidatus Odinarchaeota archaeon]
MNFLNLVTTLDAVSKTTKKKKKVNLVAKLLRDFEKDEITSASMFLAGKIFPENDERVLNISWSNLMGALRNVIDFKEEDLGEFYGGDVGEAIASLLQSRAHSQQSVLFHEPLTINSVSDRFTKIAIAGGKGSIKEKQLLISSLLAQASPREIRYLIALILNDMRTGLSQGLLAESIAEAFSVNIELVRRAWNFSGNLGEVAKISLEHGNVGLKKVTVRLMVAVKPMLASPITDLNEALEIGNGKRVSFELKFDGARVQIHKKGKHVRIFSRGLNDVTSSLSEIAREVNEKVKTHDCILDGEVVAVDSKGKPYPFQVIMRKFGRIKADKTTPQEIKLLLYVFDILQLNDTVLVDEPYSKRRTHLESVLPSSMIVERVVTDKLKVAEDFFNRSKEIGHEGLMAKLLNSPYVPGVRGKHWLKIKHTLNTLDLVIIAAEWGHGRRSNWLSDYHLAVLDEDTNDFVMIGKTFKGLTDEELQEMTEKLQQIQVSKARGYVKVKPEVVVEIKAAEIQESSKYASGLALRFARVTRIRDDKSPEEATTLKELHAAFEAQFRYKAR